MGTQVLEFFFKLRSAFQRLNQGQYTFRTDDRSISNFFAHFFVVKKMINNRPNGWLLLMNSQISVVTKNTVVQGLPWTMEKWSNNIESNLLLRLHRFLSKPWQRLLHILFPILDILAFRLLIWQVLQCICQDWQHEDA